MQNKILTISIAAYNVEKYIKDTLDSLVCDEILDDIEVLIINDGSTDNTSKIAKIYMDKYPNSFRLINKKNAGYGSTVNYSIEHANGKYFKLLDGDDFFEKEGFIKLVSFLKTTETDVVFTKFTKIYYDRNNQLISKKDGIKYSPVYYNKDINIRSLDYNEGIPMHAITYKIKVLRDSNLRLKERMLYTDNYYATIPFSKVNKLIFKDINVYNYRLGMTSQSMSKESMSKHVDQIREISLDLVDFYNTVEDDNYAKMYLRTKVAATCVDFFATLYRFRIENYIKRMQLFDKEIKEKSFDIYKKMEQINRNASKLLRLYRLLYII